MVARRGGPRSRIVVEDVVDGTVTPEGKVIRKYRPRKGRSPDVDAPVPPRVVNRIPPPPWVHLNPHATEIWNRVTDLLHERNQLSEDSRSSLEGLCQCYADWRRLRDFVEANGHTYQIVNPVFAGAMQRGNLEPEEAASNPIYQITKKRPEATEFAEVDRRFRAWLIEFGLTDYSRGRIRVAPRGKAAGTSGLEDYGL